MVKKTESIIKDRKETPNKSVEMKTIMSEKKNILGKIKNILEMTNKKISESEDIVIKLSKIKQEKYI